MDSWSYEEQAAKFDRGYTDLAERLGGGAPDHTRLKLLHATLGVAGEAGELVDAVKKHVLYNKPLDVENLKEECGDLLWYMTLLLTTIESDFSEVMQMNIDKLSKRYPEGYTDKHAQLRLDKK